MVVRGGVCSLIMRRGRARAVWRKRLARARLILMLGISGVLLGFRGGFIVGIERLYIMEREGREVYVFRDVWGVRFGERVSFFSSAGIWVQEKL